MTISKELDDTIETEMASLDDKELLRPGYAYDDYVDDYSRLLGQAAKDKPWLVGAGFEYDAYMPKYEAYLEKLSFEHGSRVNAGIVSGEDIKEFKAAMPRAVEDKKQLMVMGRFVVSRSKDPEAKRVYKNVMKGSGYIDTLNDNIAMVGFARQYPTLASRIKPGGQAIDEAFLVRVETEAAFLLKLRGIAVTSDDEESRRVNRQNRLLTLCILAERDIKEYADGAFYKDIARYNRDYARTYVRPEAESEDDIEQPKTPAENSK